MIVSFDLYVQVTHHPPRTSTNNLPPKRHHFPMTSLGTTCDREGKCRHVDLNDLTLYENRCPVTDIKYWTERQFTVSQHKSNNPPAEAAHADEAFQPVTNNPLGASAPHYTFRNPSPEVGRHYTPGYPARPSNRDKLGHLATPLERQPSSRLHHTSRNSHRRSTKQRRRSYEPPYHGS